MEGGRITLVKAEESIRCVQDADTAILFIHGILGTPDHFTPFLPFVPSNWSIYNMLLKGHGGYVKDFSAASMNEWKQQVHTALQYLLASHDKVVIAAHSMGTLFAIQEAIDNQVAALFLLNTPLKIRITPRLFDTSLKIFLGNIRPDDEWTIAAHRAYGIADDTNILHYVGWVPRFLELFSEIRKTRTIANQLSTPTQVYLSLKDEMISPKTGKAFEKNPHVTAKLLNTSGHFYYSPQDQHILQKGFRDMVQKVLV